MDADSEFYLRPYNGSSLLLMHPFRQGQPARYCRVLVFCLPLLLQFGRQLGRVAGRRAKTSAMALRRLQSHCGSLSPEQQTCVHSLTPGQSGDPGRCRCGYPGYLAR
ncbi:MAG: hypothetical protein ACK52U_06030 [Synechococcaceae cyanobacterium]